MKAITITKDVVEYVESVVKKAPKNDRYNRAFSVAHQKIRSAYPAAKSSDVYEAAEEVAASIA